MPTRVVPSEERELIGSPFPGIVGDEVTYTIDFGASVTFDASSWMHAWKGTTDVSSVVLSGSCSASGNILTLKKISSELAAEYRYTVKALCDGQYIVYFFRRKVERESGTK